jgi:hypothetical protein
VRQVLGFDVVPSEATEPVLDIPAVDMTDTAGPSTKASRPIRESKGTTRKSSGRQRRRPTKSTASDARTPSRDGSVGRQTFQQVEALVDEGKTKTEAFKQVAAATGRKVGTVSANYYRVARTNGAGKPRGRRGKASTATAPQGRRNGAHTVKEHRSVSTGKSIDEVVGQLVASLEALAEAVKAQDAEVRQLRGRLDGVRGLLS